VLSVKKILDATGGSLVAGANYVFRGLSIDSRTIKEGELFVPIRGERFDGHDFITESLKKGAGALVERKWLKGHAPDFGSNPVIAVEDTLKALQNMARFVRKGFDGPVVAVAGSNGKTTTKELICSILSSRLNVLKTEGNLNNHIGMPLCIIRAAEETDVMVLEMGTNRPGDIDMLCGIASPDMAVITNIGMEHLEGFGSLEKVRDEELSILNYVRRVALNGDDAFMLGGISMKYNFPVLTYGIDNQRSEITARDIELKEEGADFVLSAKGFSIRIESKLSGRFNVLNSLAAASVANMLGFNLDDIKKGLEAFSGVRMRFEIRKTGGATYLYDVYNANPSSMSVSIQELVRLTGSSQGRAIAVLGDMLELGDFGGPAHEEVGSLLRGHKIGYFIGVGDLMKKAVSAFGSSGVWTEAAAEAGEKLARLVRPGDVVLIKGSRGMKMEMVMEIIEKGSAGKNDNIQSEGRK
jgi:UDP-N-acetylmuramoyl-tripeptide--D-alanyl-D-alanine ligase